MSPSLVIRIVALAAIGKAGKRAVLTALARGAGASSEPILAYVGATVASVLALVGAVFF